MTNILTKEKKKKIALTYDAIVRMI